MKKNIQGLLIVFIFLYGVLKNIDLKIPLNTLTVLVYIYLFISLLLIILLWYFNFKTNRSLAISWPTSIYGVFWSILLSITYFYNLKINSAFVLSLMVTIWLLSTLYLVFSPLYRKDTINDLK
jgi:hypothetical protein